MNYACFVAILMFPYFLAAAETPSFVWLEAEQARERGAGWKVESYSAATSRGDEAALRPRYSAARTKPATAKPRTFT